MSHEALIATLREETQARMVGVGRVLLLQDTTSLDFSAHEAVEGLGTLESQGRRGLLVHSTLAVSQSRLPLGVVAQQVWVRPPEQWGKAAERHETAFGGQRELQVGGRRARTQQWASLDTRGYHGG